MTSGCKWRGPILILALHKFVTYLLRHLSTYSPDPHGAASSEKTEIKNREK